MISEIQKCVTSLISSGHSNPSKQHLCLMKKTIPQPPPCWSSNAAHDLQYITKTISNLRILWHKNVRGEHPDCPVNHWMTVACPVDPQSHNHSGTVAFSYCFKWRIWFPIFPQLSVFITQQQEFPKHPLISLCKFQQVCKCSAFYWCCSSTQHKSLVFKRNKNIPKE